MTHQVHPQGTSALAQYVHILGRGPGRSRSMTQTEAREAMTLMLGNDAAPEAVGAILTLMRLKGETPDEIAGFAEAARANLGDWSVPEVDLDWPSYAAGRSRGLPYFLLAALLLAENGVRIALHAYNSHLRHQSGSLAALAALGLAPARSPGEARSDLARHGITYVPLGTLSPRLLELLRLREVLGVRTCINTVLRLLNPWRAPAAIQGVFHPPYIALQYEACRRLEQPSMSVFKGGGGEAERTPLKAVHVVGLRAGAPIATVWAALIEGEHRRLNEDEKPDLARLVALWQGMVTDPIAEAIVTGSAAVALETVGRAGSPEEADKLASALWARRERSLLPRRTIAA